MRLVASRAAVIAGVVLAAGASSRLHAVKQILPLGGRPLLEWPLAAMRQYVPGRLVVVLGHEAGAIARAVNLDGFDVVVNTRYAEGLSTSLRAGLTHLGEDISAAMLAAGDQPLVTADLFRRLEARYRETGQPIVATDYGGHKGIPLLLDRSVWQLAQSIQGDQGARVLLRAQPDRVALVDATEWRTELDVDTPAQYEQVAALIEQSGIQPGMAIRHGRRCPVPVP